MTEPSPREEGDHGPPPAVRVHKNQMEHSGDDSKGDDKGRAARETVAGVGAALENFLSKKCFQMVFYVSAML